MTENQTGTTGSGMPPLQIGLIAATLVLAVAAVFLFFSFQGASGERDDAEEAATGVAYEAATSAADAAEARDIQATAEGERSVAEEGATLSAQMAATSDALAAEAEAEATEAVQSEATALADRDEAQAQATEAAEAEADALAAQETAEAMATEAAGAESTAIAGREAAEASATAVANVAATSDAMREEAEVTTTFAAIVQGTMQSGIDTLVPRAEEAEAAATDAAQVITILEIQQQTLEADVTRSASVAGTAIAQATAAAGQALAPTPAPTVPSGVATGAPNAPVTASFSSTESSFTFDYPQGWFTRNTSDRPNLVDVFTSFEVFPKNWREELVGNERVIRLELVNVDEFIDENDLSGWVLGVANLLYENEDRTDPVDVVEGSRILSYSDVGNGTVRIIVVRLGEMTLGIVRGFAPVGQMEGFMPSLRAVAASMQPVAGFTAGATPAPTEAPVGGLAERFTSENTDFSFGYPDGWTPASYTNRRDLALVVSDDTLITNVVTNQSAAAFGPGDRGLRIEVAEVSGDLVANDMTGWAIGVANVMYEGLGQGEARQIDVEGQPAAYVDIEGGIRLVVIRLADGVLAIGSAFAPASEQDAFLPVVVQILYSIQANTQS